MQKGMVNSHEIPCSDVSDYIPLPVVRDGKKMMTDAEKAERDLLEEWRLLHEEVDAAVAEMAVQTEKDRQKLIGKGMRSSVNYPPLRR